MEINYVKIQFDIELAKKITNGEVEGKVVTRDGQSVRIVCFDAKQDDPVVALISYDNAERVKSYAKDGIVFEAGTSPIDLMLEVPEYMTFKDGDILTYRKNENRWSIFVYKNRDSDVLANYVEYDCNSRGNNIIKFERSFYNSNFCKKATEEEKQKLIKALKASKEPKAKKCLKMLGIEVKHEFEFKPFDKVLVRNSDEMEWIPRFFERYSETANGGRTITMDRNSWKYCIPYEGNEHLLGTTEDYE